MVDCNDHNSQESNDVLAARVLASLDSFKGLDSSAVVEADFGETAQLHYVVWKAQLDAEQPVYGPINFKGQLESPYKKYFETPGLDRAAHMAIGLHPDFNTHPSEILGDDIVRPVEKAWRAYSDKITGLHESGAFDNYTRDIETRSFKNEELRELVEKAKDESGWLDAVEEARETIEDRFGDDQDPDRYREGMRWLSDIERPNSPDDIHYGFLVDLTNNFVENSLRNNTVSSARNYFDRLRALYQFGAGNYLKARTEYKKARDAIKKDPKGEAAQEMIDAGVLGSQFMEDKNGPNAFTASEPGNKALTYFAAKAHALENGMTEAKAKRYAQAAVEQIQFQSSYINRPKAFRTMSRTNLALLSFIYKERRWYLGHMRNAARMGSEDPKVQASAQNSMRVITYYLIGNALVNGINADIPEEIGQIWKLANPKGYNAFRAATTPYSLFGALNINLDEFSRIPLTNVGIATKGVAVFNALKTAVKDTWDLLEHPDKPKKWMKALKSDIMLLPSGFGVPVVRTLGNKNLGAAAEYLYRTVTGDYERYTQGHKKYVTNPEEELMNLTRSGREGLDRDLEKDSMDAHKGRRRKTSKPRELKEVREVRAVY